MKSIMAFMQKMASDTEMIIKNAQEVCLYYEGWKYKDVLDMTFIERQFAVETAVKFAQAKARAANKK